MVVGGLGRQKLVVLSYAHMLICSLLFLCEHLFTFQFCALMPKISKEIFAHNFKKFGLCGAVKAREEEKDLLAS